MTRSEKAERDIDQMPKREHVWKTQASAKAFADCCNKDDEDDIVYRVEVPSANMFYFLFDKIPDDDGLFLAGRREVLAIWTKGKSVDSKFVFVQLV